MRDKPTGVDLLELGRDILRQQLLKDISAENKYLALMVANAMAIAARQLDATPAPENLPDFQQLSQDIRQGKVSPDSARYGEVYELLLEHTHRKVLESNPGYLDK